VFRSSKILIVILAFLFSAPLYAQKEDTRPVILIHAVDPGRIAKEIVASVAETAVSKGKIRVVVREKLVFDEAKLGMAGFLSAETQQEFKMLGAQYLVLLYPLDQKLMVKSRDDGYSDLTFYLKVDLKVVRVDTSELVISKVFESNGYASTGPYTSFAEARDRAEKYAVNSVAYNLYSELHTLVTVRALVVARQDNTVVINKGRLDGVVVGAYFTFLKLTEIAGDTYENTDGIAVVERVSDHTAILKVLEWPKFDLTGNVMVKELPRETGGWGIFSFGILHNQGSELGNYGADAEFYATEYWLVKLAFHATDYFGTGINASMRLGIVEGRWFYTDKSFLAMGGSVGFDRYTAIRGRYAGFLFGGSVGVDTINYVEDMVSAAFLIPFVEMHAGFRVRIGGLVLSPAVGYQLSFPSGWIDLSQDVEALLPEKTSGKIPGGMTVGLSIGWAF